MANVAAHLVDRVLPAVPVRQWVLSLPFELRTLAAFRADVLSALGRVFIEAGFASYRSRAKQEGLGEAPTGAVTHVQSFGSPVNLNVHFHSMLLVGVFTRISNRVEKKLAARCERYLASLHCEGLKQTRKFPG